MTKVCSPVKAKQPAAAASPPVTKTTATTKTTITKWFLLVVVPALVAYILAVVLRHQQQNHSNGDNTTCNDSNAGGGFTAWRFNSLLQLSVPEWLSPTNIADHLMSLDYIAALQRFAFAVFWSSRLTVLTWLFKALVLLRICAMLLRKAQDRRAEHPQLSFTTSARNARIAKALARKKDKSSTKNKNKNDVLTTINQQHNDSNSKTTECETDGMAKVIDARKYASNIATNATVQTFMFSALPGPLDSSLLSAIRADDLVYSESPMYVPENLGPGHFMFDWINAKLTTPTTTKTTVTAAAPTVKLVPVAEDAPILILLPGVVGSSRDPYLGRVARLFLKNGYRVGGKNWRGFAQGQTKLGGSRPETWDSQSIIDMHVCIEQVREQFPRTKGVYALGFSTGGIIVCTYLGMCGAQQESAKDVANMWPMCDDVSMGLKKMKLSPLSGGVAISGLVDTAVALEDLEDPTRFVPYSLGLGLLSCTAALSFQDELKTFSDVTAPIRNIKKVAQNSAEKQLPRLIKGLMPLWNAYLRVRDITKACVPASVRAQLARWHPISSMQVGLDAFLVPFKFMHEHGIVGIVNYHDVFTCAHADFVDEKDYRRYMHEVHTTFLQHTESPLLCIVARDDPLFKPSIVDTVRHLVEASPGGMILESETGGHCGFFHGLSMKPYADMMSLSFFDACVDTHVDADQDASTGAVVCCESPVAVTEPVHDA